MRSILALGAVFSIFGGGICLIEAVVQAATSDGHSDLLLLIVGLVLWLLGVVLATKSDLGQIAIHCLAMGGVCSGVGLIAAASGESWSIPFLFIGAAFGVVGTVLMLFAAEESKRLDMPGRIWRRVKNLLPNEDKRHELLVRLTSHLVHQYRKTRTLVLAQTVEDEPPS
jgi:hypothetical protein